MVLQIDGRSIGDGFPTYLIAEIGLNHGGDLTVAKEMVLSAKAAGVDAVKFQIFKVENFISNQSEYYSILDKCVLNEVEIRDLFQFCKKNVISAFGSVFDNESANLLNNLGCPAFKIASGDITHHPLINSVADFGKPVIVSTGGANLNEVLEVDAILSAKGTPRAFLHCISLYPTDISQLDLATIKLLRKKLTAPVGFSDHSVSSIVPLVASAFGASIIEKHYTMDKQMEGPDHLLSADPEEMLLISSGLKTVFEATGVERTIPIEPLEHINNIRRSVCAAVNISSGEVISEDKIKFLRPGTGIKPADFRIVVGRTAACDISSNQQILPRMLV